MNQPIAADTDGAPAKPEKVRYVSRSLERHIMAPRDLVWSVMLREIQTLTGGYVVEGDPAPHGVGSVIHLAAVGDIGPLVETVLSFEPPWRRAYKVEGDTLPLDFYEGTFVLRDDGPECHISWGVVIDPEPTDEGWAFLDTALAFIGNFLDHLVVTAEAEA